MTPGQFAWRSGRVDVRIAEAEMMGDLADGRILHRPLGVFPGLRQLPRD
jgi:hypothetical protein